jgi:septal ring-binding cell division protein DamX
LFHVPGVSHRIFFCEVMMNTRATVTLVTGQKVKGRLTTDHAASSYGQPVFVSDDGTAYNWAEIANVITTEAQSKGGSRSTPATRRAARESGKKGGRPQNDRLRRQTERKLAAKRARLAELQQQYRNATSDASRVSFAGKITRCRRDIEIFENRLAE